MEPKQTPSRPSRHQESDGASGNKTSKSGKREPFFGFEEHTLVQVADRNGPPVPALIKRLEFTPAAEDVVDVSLSLLDRLNEPAKVLIADRHYSYKQAERWRDPLAERDIDPIIDLRKDEHGFTELEHLRWAAGWPHCPSTPDRYATIPRPGPTDDDQALWDRFYNDIAERELYAMRRVAGPDQDGTARWQCPAIDGKVGCPHRPGTVETAVQIGLPIIENPPDLNGPDVPRCCTQQTVKINPGPLRKLAQRYYWGSPKWETEWNKRTYVEGSYGNRKNQSTENLGRGHIRTTGLPLHHIQFVVTALVYNLRISRNFAERHGIDPASHPLLAPEPPSFGQVRLTEAEYLAISDTPDAEPT